MNKRYLIIIILLFFFLSMKVEAIKIGDCEIIASYRLTSGIDDERYICKNISSNSVDDGIYYDAKSNKISLNNFEGFYLSVYSAVSIEVNEKNSISFLNNNNNLLSISGLGSLKFKGLSYTKKVVNGINCYNFEFKNYYVVDDENKIFVGTIDDFANNFNLLKQKNNLPDEFDVDDYVLDQAIDFVNIDSVAITDVWMEKNIKTSNNAYVSNGYGIVEYVENEKIDDKSNFDDANAAVLEKDNVTLYSSKKSDSKYRLSVSNLSDAEIAEDIKKQLDGMSLVDLYDFSVYNGKKIVSMKNGKYVIKIKISDSIDEYNDFKIIYVSDDGNIEEYIDAMIEEDYISFETTHLSQYGIIANIKDISDIGESSVQLKKKMEINGWFFAKIAILLLTILIPFVLVMIISIKSGVFVKKSKRRKRKLQAS